MLILSKSSRYYKLVGYYLEAYLPSLEYYCKPIGYNFSDQIEYKPIIYKHYKIYSCK